MLAALDLSLSAPPAWKSDPGWPANNMRGKRTTGFGTSARYSPVLTPQLEKAECMIHHWGNTIASKLFWAFLLCNNLQVFCIFGNWTACSVCFGYLERKIVHGWWGRVVHVSLLILLDFFRQYGEEKKKKSSVTRTHAAYSSYCFTYHVQFSVLCHIIKNTKTKAGSHT